MSTHNADTDRPEFRPAIVGSIMQSAKSSPELLLDAEGVMLVPLAKRDDYAVLAYKHFEVATTKSRLEAELSSAITEIARGMIAHRDRRIEQQAQAIIDGRQAEAFAGFEELQTRVVRLREEAAAYGEAQRLLREQMEEVKSERSIDAAEAVGPLHRRAVHAVADAATALIKALQHEELIRRSVTEAGFDARLPAFGVALPIAREDAPLPMLARQAREYAG